MTKWISVKDRLPYSGDYLVCTKTRCMYVATYYFRLPDENPNQTNWTICCDCETLSNGDVWPEYWMKIPDPPYKPFNYNIGEEDD